MFNTAPVLSFRVPVKMESKFDFVHRAVFISLGVMFAGMFSASLHQYIYSIKATTLLESLWPMQALMMGGFLSFLCMLASFIALLVWCDIREFFFKKKEE